MDNKAYLDQIAVKGKKTGVAEKLLTPAIIKLLAAGIVAIVLCFVMIGILNSNSGKNTQKFEAIYQRAASLADQSGPMRSYHENLKSSDLRQYNMTLQDILASFNSSYSALASTAGFDPLNLSADVLNEDATNTALIEQELRSGYLNGLLDHTYAATAHYQVSVLISMNQEALLVSTNTQLSDVINQFNNQLIELQKLYKEYANTH